MSFFIINDIRLNLPMGWVPFQMLYLGSFSNVRCNKSELNRYIAGEMNAFQKKQTPKLEEKPPKPKRKMRL